MRIVFSTDWYSEGMGYSENVLPRVLRGRGHEVFVVSSTMQVYGDHDFYRAVYERFLGPPVVEAGTKVIDGVSVIRLPILLWWRRLRVVRSRVRTIRRLKPDVVFVYDPRSLQTLMLSIASRVSRYRLFTAVHTVASVYPAYYEFHKMSWFQRSWLRLSETLVGWVAARRISVCYAPTPDAGEIATRFFGVAASKVKALPLGLDVAHFRPSETPGDVRARDERREALGVTKDEILVIYTGRFTPAKNPLCLAVAIGQLRMSGRPFKGLFLGEGQQAEEIARIPGCHAVGFVSYSELPSYYRAADVGVWPREESLSMTDAASCGLPLVVSDRMKALDRIEEGGLTYRENDASDLARVLMSLEDPSLRSRLGAGGAARMRQRFSLERIADVLEHDFECAVSGTPASDTVAS